jgi:hypothetical protein
VTLPGLSAPVTVYRDSHGIPQVYASTPADLFRAQGYLHAQDRFWEMDFRRHVTAGRLSELFGAKQVPTDAFLRTLGWRRVAQREWDAVVSPEVKGYLLAYAEGVNDWIAATGGASPSGAKSLEYTVLGLTNGDYTIEPWSPVDSLAWLKAMAWDLRGNMESEIGRAVLLASGLTREQVDQLYPAYPYDRHQPIVDSLPSATEKPTTPANGVAWNDVASTLDSLSDAMEQLPQLMGDGGPGIGSNSWVISGAHTKVRQAAARQRPAPEPVHARHLVPDGPALRVPVQCGGLHVLRRARRRHRHNARIAWGFTNLDPDVTDLYLEKARRRQGLRRHRVEATVHSRRGHQGGRRPVRHRHRALDQARPAAVGPLAGPAHDGRPARGRRVRLAPSEGGARRRPRRWTPRRPASLPPRRSGVRRRAALDGPGSRKHGGGAVPAEPGDRLVLVPGRRLAVRRAGAEHRVRRRRRQHRVPVAGADPGPRPGRRDLAVTGLGSLVRLEGFPALRPAARPCSTRRAGTS